MLARMLQIPYGLSRSEETSLVATDLGEGVDALLCGGGDGARDGNVLRVGDFGLAAPLQQRWLEPGLEGLGVDGVDHRVLHLQCAFREVAPR